MKIKKWSCFCLSATTIIIGLLWLNIKTETRLLPEKKYNLTENYHYEKLFIMMGDSWGYLANETDFCQHLEVEFEKHNIKMGVKAIGISGHTTKQIYSEILDSVLLHRPQYVMLAAGINDQNQQLGPKYYAHHATLIMKALLLHNIIPILIELPKWYIVERTGVRGRKERLMLRLKMFCTTGQIDYTAENNIYRKALIEKLEQADILNDVLRLNIDELGSEYWADYVHLNRRGYEKLAEKAASIICILHTPVNSQ